MTAGKIDQGGALIQLRGITKTYGSGPAACSNPCRMAVRR